MTETKFDEYRIYKPNPKGVGAASRLSMRLKEGKYRDVLVFWEATLQTGMDGENASFGWKDKTKTIPVKLGILDIGDILCVLRGVKKELGTGKGLFHKNTNGNTTLQLTVNDKGGYYLRIATKRGSDPLLEIKHTISLAEAEVLRVLLERAVAVIHNW